jgi:flagellar basal-body rod protein FlgG
MLKGLYQSAAGMIARQSGQDIIANNLANASTPGFQREIATARGELMTPPGPAARTGQAKQIEQLKSASASDLRPGAMKSTGNSADIALDGPGYLVAQTAQGQRLVRGGTMHSNARGELSTANGDPLLDSAGRTLQVDGKAWTMKTDGTVLVGTNAVGKLRIALPQGETRREGASLVAAGGLRDAPANGTRVLQGALEQSNVEPVREMVDMIAGMRAYEAGQKAISAQDQTLQGLFEILRG